MSKWGRTDYKQLKQLSKRLQNVQNVGLQKFNETQIKLMAQRFLRSVIRRTPTITGELRRGWTIGNIVRRADVYEIEVINKKLYASYVEYGHRQQIGRYVKAIGKRLVKGWVEGRFMMTITKSETERDAPKILEREFSKLLSGMLNDK